MTICVRVATAQKPSLRGKEEDKAPLRGAQAARHLQGASWALDIWDIKLTMLPPVNKMDRTVVACYRLVYDRSAMFPFLLQPAITAEQRKGFDLKRQVDKQGNLTETDPGIMDGGRQSWRRASMGSIREARRAGIQHANAATTKRMAGADEKVTGSVGVTL
jgi:hypothetical protein